MKLETGKAHTANLLLPFALFGFLAPVATYLVAVSNLSVNLKTGILSVLAGSYFLLFVISYRRLRATVDKNAGTRVQRREVRDGQPVGMTEAGDHDGADNKGHIHQEEVPAYLVILERELAECRRNPEGRAVSLLLIEVLDFKEMTGRFGKTERFSEHIDRMIRSNLRAMDIMTPLHNGEFVLVLPTAEESGALEISRRIQISFSENPIEISDSDALFIRLVIGSASFPQDGETTESLMHYASARKREAKTEQHRRQSKNKPSA